MVNCEQCGREFKQRFGKERYKVGQYTLDGVLVKEFKSELEATKITNIRHINEVTRGIRKQAGGYIWKRIAHNVE